MSISNVLLIRDSLSLINVLAVGESMEPEHSELGLRKLNALLAEWREDEIDLQYYEQTVEDLGNDCPIPEDAQLAVTYYLSFALAPHYGKRVSQEMVTLAETYYARLRRNSAKDRVISIKPALPRGEGQSCTSDILNG